jgi:hypothetical protein
VPGHQSAAGNTTIRFARAHASENLLIRIHLRSPAYTRSAVSTSTVFECSEARATSLRHCLARWPARASFPRRSCGNAHAADPRARECLPDLKTRNLGAAA